MKKIFLILVGLVVLLIVIGVIGITYLKHDLESVETLTIGSVDLLQVEDGTYEGLYENGRFTNTIAVTVENHVITSLVMKDDVGFVKDDIRESLFNNIINLQQNDVDPIAGSSITCKAYLKSIENALKKGLTHV